MTQSLNSIHEELLALYISFNTSHKNGQSWKKTSRWNSFIGAELVLPAMELVGYCLWTPVKRDLSWLIKTDAERIFFASKSHQSLSHSNSPSLQNMNCQGCWMGLMHLASMLKRNQKTLLWVGVDKMLAEQLASSPFTYWRLCEKDERLWKIIFDSEWL